VYKVEIGPLVIHVESMEELREVVRNFSGSADAAAVIAQPAAPVASDAPPLEDAPPRRGPGRPPKIPKNTPSGARYAPVEVKIRSSSPEEAMAKFYKALDNAMHRDALRFLASRGEKGASIEELKEALKLPANHKMGGMTAAIRRRAPHYGLEAEDIFIVEYRGIVAGVRVLDYRIGPKLLAMMEKQGLVPKGEEQQ
jgi:hypothetical protein